MSRPCCTCRFTTNASTPPGARRPRRTTTSGRRVDLTHGEVIETLVANRLTSPTPLLRVEDWARSWAVPELFGVAAEALNDDRVGRALDAIAPQVHAKRRGCDSEDRWSRPGGAAFARVEYQG